jgi:hypothetical protein
MLPPAGKRRELAFSRYLPFCMRMRALPEGHDGEAALGLPASFSHSAVIFGLTCRPWQDGLDHRDRAVRRPFEDRDSAWERNAFDPFEESLLRSPRRRSLWTPANSCQCAAFRGLFDVFASGPRNLSSISPPLQPPAPGERRSLERQQRQQLGVRGRTAHAGPRSWACPPAGRRKLYGEAAHLPVSLDR